VRGHRGGVNEERGHRCRKHESLHGPERQW
jgi:hypothetical protein